MTLRHMLVPFIDRDLLRRILAYLDQIKGLPRTHSASEPGISIGAGNKPPYTETLFQVQIHANSGPVALRRLIAVTVDDIATQLRERFVDHLGVRKRLREWIVDRGWQLRTDLPEGDLDPSPWTPVPVRDGATGSTDGVPIPEGSE